MSATLRLSVKIIQIFQARCTPANTLAELDSLLERPEFEAPIRRGVCARYFSLGTFFAVIARIFQAGSRISAVINCRNALPTSREIAQVPLFRARRTTRGRRGLDTRALGSTRHLALGRSTRELCAYCMLIGSHRTSPS